MDEISLATPPPPPERRPPLGPVGRLAIVLGLGITFAMILHLLGFNSTTIVAFATILIGVLAGIASR